MDSRQLSDDEIIGSVQAIGLADAAQFGKPEDFYGDETWSRMLADDAESGGMNAVAKFEFDWGFGSTPGQRAKAVWVNRMSRDASGLFDSIHADLASGSRELDGPALDSVLRRRSGIGGM